MCKHVFSTLLGPSGSRRALFAPRVARVPLWRPTLTMYAALSLPPRETKHRVGELILYSPNHLVDYKKYTDYKHFALHHTSRQHSQVQQLLPCEV